MLKRIAYILISVWLINALVCFHPTDAAEIHAEAAKATNGPSFSDNTLLDLLLHHISDDDDYNGSHQHHKIANRNRYVLTRTLGFNLQVPFTHTFQWLNAVQYLHTYYGRFWEKKVFLPPHHNFLFRLSPF
ncbi:hypothetical protein [Mucilaginibacter sp. KACC 22063]|uniref:hypothetical protein n=1 Tax=Mucilaginibacter sp. KACC 22063 TaxID=3025666 RepID=UPI002365D247|nr:hypothetical protein [Mucilaginibacter sp. KACC 22063]WDF56954.1 hypothetical protein PQ461_07790 [Mucilaginibacter sp. KACC 22063]